MKKVIVATICLILCNCSSQLSIVDISKCTKMCEAHQGINYIFVDMPYYRYQCVCNDGSYSSYRPMNDANKRSLLREEEP